jgi:hypothetical protein
MYSTSMSLLLIWRYLYAYCVAVLLQIFVHVARQTASVMNCWRSSRSRGIYLISSDLNCLTAMLRIAFACMLEEVWSRNTSRKLALSAGLEETLVVLCDWRMMNGGRVPRSIVVHAVGHLRRLRLSHFRGDDIFGYDRSIGRVEPQCYA